MPWDLIGLGAAKSALSDMLRSGRVPHALMLTGPKGAGKFALSTALAQALNCLSPDEDLSPCLNCASCKKTAAMSHPDFMVVEPSGAAASLRIDDIRALRSSLAFRPFEGKSKVAVVRGAETFREDSGGALLKTLEEPAPDTVIILNALSESAVLQTLVSRCVRLRVPPLPRPRILSALLERGLPPDQAALLAGLSGGALGAAMAMDGAEAEGVWKGLDVVLSLKGRPGALSAALEWTAELTQEKDKARRKDEPKPSARPLQELIVSCLRLWHRDVAALAATGQPGRLLGPMASSAQFAWAKSLTSEGSAAFEKALGSLADSLARGLKADIVFENFWLDVLE